MFKEHTVPNDRLKSVSQKFLLEANMRVEDWHVLRLHHSRQNCMPMDDHLGTGQSCLHVTIVEIHSDSS